MEITACIIREDETHTITAPSGTLLSELLQIHGPFDLPCGGKTRCRRCRIRTEGHLSPPAAVELAAFSAVELTQGLRLACAAQADGNVTIWPEAAAIFTQICDEGATVEVTGSPRYKKAGLAVDIGTTTLCLRLYGSDGLLGSQAAKNPQSAFGADVISRIEQALAGRGPELAESIRQELSALARSAVTAAGLTMADIDAAVITGNTTMLYLLTGHSPQALSKAPFIADHLFGEDLTAAATRKLFPDLASDCTIHLPRCISAFVGADITTALLASGMCDQPATALLVDIGTNGEIALWHKGQLFVSSTAAGPAFEGAGLTCGVYGIRGAIDRVWHEEGKICFTTIDEALPTGICGSGVVDALACMLELAVIDDTGAFATEQNFQIANHQVVTPADVRQLQLAKGSIRAGMETLLQTAGVAWSELSNLYIAGGFGNYLDLRSAAAIGLIPGEMLNRTQVLGNAALAGSALLLLNQELSDRAQQLAEQAQPVALDANPLFMEQFMEQMYFGNFQVD